MCENTQTSQKKQLRLTFCFWRCFQINTYFSLKNPLLCCVLFKACHVHQGNLCFGKCCIISFCGAANLLLVIGTILTTLQLCVHLILNKFVTYLTTLKLKVHNSPSSDLLHLFTALYFEKLNLDRFQRVLFLNGTANLVLILPQFETIQAET